MSFWKNNNEYKVNLDDFVERFVAHNTCITLYTTEKTSGGHIWHKVWSGMDWQIAPDYIKSEYYHAHPDVLPCPYTKYNVVAVWGAFEGFHSVDDIALEIEMEVKNER